MADYLQVPRDQRLGTLDNVGEGRENDPDLLARWLLGEEDTERAFHLVDLLRPHLPRHPQSHWLPLLDELAMRHPRVAHFFGAALAAADVRSVVGPEPTTQLPVAATADPIPAFYRRERPDAVGRFIDEILAWPDERLEDVHDYIQWLFPTGQRSGVNPDAPLVTQDTMAAFAGDEELRRGLFRSFNRMLSFYGLERRADEVVPIVRRGANYRSRRDNWLIPGNHNHLRITRMLVSLCLLGVGKEAAAFAQCLHEIYQLEGPSCITPTSYHFWMRAVGRSEE